MKFLINFFNKYLIKLIILMLIISMVRNVMHNLNSNKELVEARRELEELKQENNKLSSELNILDTQEYAEFIARSELGLVRDNEVVLVLPDDEFLENLVKNENEKEMVKEIPNWQKWKKLLL